MSRTLSRELWDKLGCFAARNGSEILPSFDPGIALLAGGGGFALWWMTASSSRRHFRNAPETAFFLLLFFGIGGLLPLAALVEGLLDGSVITMSRRGRGIYFACSANAFWMTSGFYFAATIVSATIAWTAWRSWSAPVGRAERWRRARRSSRVGY